MVKLKDWSVIGLLCLCILTFIVGLPLGIKEYIVQAYKIPAGSMLPTLQFGDHILAKKYSITMENTERGDIIIFKYPKDETKDFVKRVIGLPGEIVEILNKQVYINQQPLEEKYIVHNDSVIYSRDAQPRDNFGPVVIPNDSYFVMCKTPFDFLSRLLELRLSGCIFPFST
ncbi:MAG: signal peptidase I [Nitrospira sp.]|nr:signal peptidase I [Nitrospira sp.]